jgi:hypothetical protein
MKGLEIELPQIQAYRRWKLDLEFVWIIVARFFPIIVTSS